MPGCFCYKLKNKVSHQNITKLFTYSCTMRIASKTGLRFVAKLKA